MLGPSERIWAHSIKEKTKGVSAWLIFMSGFILDSNGMWQQPPRHTQTFSNPETGWIGKTWPGNETRCGLRQNQPAVNDSVLWSAHRDGVSSVRAIMTGSNAHHRVAKAGSSCEEVRKCRDENQRRDSKEEANEYTENPSESMQISTIITGSYQDTIMKLAFLLSVKSQSAQLSSGHQRGNKTVVIYGPRHGERWQQLPPFWSVSFHFPERLLTPSQINSGTSFPHFLVCSSSTSSSLVSLLWQTAAWSSKCLEASKGRTEARTSHWTLEHRDVQSQRRSQFYHEHEKPMKLESVSLFMC